MCTRTLYVGSENLVLTGRGMDWGEDIRTNAWVMPRGMTRQGLAGPNSLSWTSTYGSLGFTAYDGGTCDGINERGLVVNALYLAEADYGQPDDRPTMTVMTYPQYVLDHFASVAEAVDGLKDESFRVVGPLLPNGSPATAHLALSDPTGDSAIFEYIDGKLVIHHGSEYQVMTNSPTFDEQLAIATYWKNVDPLTFLPGSVNAADRFTRATFLLHAIPTTTDPHVISAVPGGTYQNQAVASVMSVMRSMGVPLGIHHPTRPNISSTLWRTVYDHKNLVAYFDSATSPNTFWIPMADLDFSEGAEVKKLTLVDGPVYSGNAAANFAPAEPFHVLPAEDPAPAA
ncbi:MAG: linear amide C-N hydrolase [Thermomicrobiales bacterium]